MIGNTHLVESHFLRVLKKTVGPPYVVQPTDIENTIFFGHVFWQAQAMVPPTLCQEYVCYICLDYNVLLVKFSQRNVAKCYSYHGLFIYSIDRQHSDMEIYLKQ